MFVSNVLYQLPLIVLVLRKCLALTDEAFALSNFPSALSTGVFLLTNLLSALSKILSAESDKALALTNKTSPLTAK